jgi:hypothetical protein
MQAMSVPTAADVMTREIRCLRATATVRELLEHAGREVLGIVSALDPVRRYRDDLRKG